jgi:hypothetical protein
VEKAHLFYFLDYARGVYFVSRGAHAISGYIAFPALAAGPRGEEKDADSRSPSRPNHFFFLLISSRAA